MGYVVVIHVLVSVLQSVFFSMACSTSLKKIMPCTEFFVVFFMSVIKASMAPAGVAAMESVPAGASEAAKMDAKVTAEVNEMIEYFRAFKQQDPSIREYKKYFKANMCYLEGQWEVDAVDIEEPFKSDRHEIDAATWIELNQRIRFLHAAGRKHNLEILALPQT